MSRMVELRKAYVPSTAAEGALRVRRQLMQNPIGRNSTSMFRDGLRSRGRSISTHGTPAEGEFRFGGLTGQRIDQLKAKGVSKGVFDGQKVTSFKPDKKISSQPTHFKRPAATGGPASARAAGFRAGTKLREGVKALSRFGKADRDQNSSIPTSTKLVMPASSHKAAVTSAHSRTGAFAGKSRGVGHHQTRDENSSPGHVKLTPRTVTGRFAGAGHDVQVFHPKGGVKQPGDNRIQHYRGATVGRRIRA